MKYSDGQRLEKIRSMTAKLLSYLREEQITAEIVQQKEPVRWAVTTPLYNIGEHVYYLSDAFKEKYPDIPWKKISGLRHRLVHDYENTNWSIICAILFEVLPDFYAKLETVHAQETDKS